jgi:signal peptidase II
MFRKHPLIVTALGVLALDQASKWAVLYLLRLDYYESFDILPPWLVFRLAWNQGVNFGLMSDGSALIRWLFILGAVAISVWVWIWIRRENHGFWAQIAAGFLIGGALANVIDRLIYGAVEDFLNMSCCGIENPYSFNLADVGVFLGAVGLMLTAGRAPASRNRP